jgi:Tfp pilus assembly protein PilO
LWTIGAVLVMVALVAGGWFLGIQPQVAAAALANQTRVTTEGTNATAESLLASLKKDYSDLTPLKARLASLVESVPNAANMSSFVSEINSLAGAHGVTVNTITVADATPYTPPIAPAPAPSASASPSPSPSPSATAAAPVAPTGPVAPPQVTNPKITAVNFVAIPVTLSITGSYSNVLDIVSGLQSGPRLFLVDALSTTTNGSNVDATVGGLVYVLVDAGATGSTAASASSPTSGG